MSFALKCIGLALALSGGLWMLQGLGIVTWPADSFMLAETRWALIGAISFVAGIGLFRWADRKP